MNTQRGQGSVIKSLKLNMASIIDDSESNTDPDKEALSTLQSFKEPTFDKQTGRKGNTIESSEY